MKNSQALRENRSRQYRGNSRTTESCRKACQGARADRNKEISSARREKLKPEVRVDGKYIRAVLVDPRNGRVAKVTARQKLVEGRARQVLGIEPGNSDWSVLVSAVRVPVEWHEELAADMEKTLRKQRRDRGVDDPQPFGATLWLSAGQEE